MKKWMTVIALLLCLHIRAQDSRTLVDSLVQELPAAGNDTIKARLYNRIYNEAKFINTEVAMQYARQGMAHVQKMKWPKGIAVFQTNIGQAYTDAGNYDSANHYYNAALQTHTRAGDRYNMAVTNNSIGAAAQNIRADYTTAATYYFKALQLAEELKDSTLLPLTLDNISRIFSLQKNYAKANEFGMRALRIREKSGTPDEMAASLESIGKTYYSAGNSTEAQSYLRKAQAIYESSGNLVGLASTWSGLSLVYTDYNKVIDARIKSKKLWDEVNPMHPEAITNTGNLGMAYLDSVKKGGTPPAEETLLLQKAEDNLNTAINLAGQTGDIDNKSFFTGSLAELQELKGDYRNAYYNYRQHKDMQDSIYSQETKNKIAEAESQRAIDKKNSELQINQLALSNQRKTLWGLVGVLVLLSAIGILLYRQSKMRKRTNETLLQLNSELDQANKLKAKFFGILSHDLRAPVANLINFLHLRNNNPELLTPEQSSRHEKKLTGSAEALLENMESLLLWSKSQMEQLSPHFTEVPTTDLFKYLENQFKHIEGITLQFDTNHHIELHTDEDCARTILYNLTSNAIKAVATVPHPQIEWKAGMREKQPFLSITDNGTGLSPALLLDDEQRATTAITVRSGLGLSIVKDLAKAINCQIIAVPMQQGTCIEIVFPVSQVK